MCRKIHFAIDLALSLELRVLDSTSKLQHRLQSCAPSPFSAFAGPPVVRHPCSTKCPLQTAARPAKSPQLRGPEQPRRAEAFAPPPSSAWLLLLKLPEQPSRVLRLASSKPVWLLALSQQMDFPVTVTKFHLYLRIAVYRQAGPCKSQCTASRAALRRWRWRWRIRRRRRQPSSATAASALPASYEHSHALKHQFSKSVMVALNSHRVTDF